MEEYNQIVVFKLGAESYGVPINDVKEIIKMEEISPIPKAPDYIAGMLNIRGDVYIVFSMRRKFGMSDKQPDDNTKIILVNGKRIGFVVDGVSEIIKVEGKDIETEIEMSIGTGENFIDGIAKVSGDIIIVLNLGNILSAQDEHEIKKLQMQ